MTRNGLNFCYPNVICLAQPWMFIILQVGRVRLEQFGRR